MDIKVSDLSLLWERLSQHLMDIGVETIEIKEDYYWNIPIAENMILTIRLKV